MNLRTRKRENENFTFDEMDTVRRNSVVLGALTLITIMSILPRLPIV